MLSITNIRERGFTIVELLVVIVIIAVLSAISVVVYSGIRQRAVHAAVESEASQLQTQLALYNAENSDYPNELEFNSDSDIDCSDEGSFCFDGQYPVIYDCDDFGSCSFEIWPDDDGDGECQAASCGGGVGGEVGNSTIIDLTPPTDCPTNFIPVPGSAKYNQVGFCVMKYEAKLANGKAVSQSEGLPAIVATYNEAEPLAIQSCDGCHLMTNKEWMTLARNVISQSGNWVNGLVGDGRMYSGNTRYSGLTDLLSASTDDNDGYFKLYANFRQDYEKRTLKLSNGQIIWDLSGNALEFVDGSKSGTDKHVIAGTGAFWFNWDNVTQGPSPLDISPFPASLNIQGVSNEAAFAQGLGKCYVSSTDTEQLALLRGSSNQMYDDGGLLSLRVATRTQIINSFGGFRVAR